MTTYKILFLDIDGTILKPDNTIEASTKEAVAQMQEIGIETVLATGRPIHEIINIGTELNIQSYIGYNGALSIYRGEEVFVEPMVAESVQFFLNIAATNGHEIVLYSNNKNYFTSLESKNVKAFIEEFHLRQNALFSNEAIHDILGMTIITNGENDQILYTADAGIHLSQVNIEGMRHCFDVIRDKVNKGVGIKFLLDRLGIQRECSIAFGDGMNDVEMLRAVGEGFAMGNAHKDLLTHAKHRTTTVTNSGVYNGLKSLGLLD